MPIAFTATLLLERQYTMDAAAIAKAMAKDYKGIGAIEGVPSPAKPASGLVTIDQTQVVLEAHSGRLDTETLVSEHTLHRPKSTSPDVNSHVAFLDICCGGQTEDLQNAERYAAAVHLVAASVARIVPTLGIFWRNSGTLTGPDAFRETVKPLFKGKMPVDIWVGFCPSVPDGFTPDVATGMQTAGLRPFLGRELELAPRRGDAETAWECLSSVTRRVLENGLTLKSGQELSDVEAVLSAKVRRRDYWLRRDRSTFVLVTDDAIVEEDTLQVPGGRRAA